MRLLLALSILPAVHAADLRSALTLRATFDGSADAAAARGDKRIYSAASYKEQASAQPGILRAHIRHEKTGGRSGGALRFTAKNTNALFYQAAKNVAFDPKNWSGTISFWLNLSPDQDLEPGFCDPIQVTDKAYNDSAIWVDFTKDERPRHFRLGVFGALKSWNPQNLPSDKNPDFNNRLVVVKQPPFARGKWTNVAIAFAGLGSGKGWAKLYLDGALQGTASNIAEPFDWDVSRGAVRLGVNYVGLFDDLAIFNRPLAGAEIKQVASGKF